MVQARSWIGDTAEKFTRDIISATGQWGLVCIMVLSHLALFRLNWTECAVKWPSLPWLRPVRMKWSKLCCPVWLVAAMANWVTSQHDLYRRNEPVVRLNEMRWVIIILFLARDVIYTSRTYATMSVSVCPSVCLWRKCISAS